MSSYRVLLSVSQTLRTILWDAYSADSLLRSMVGSEAAISYANPTETARDSANRLSLWLYQVTENEFLKNAPTARSNGHNTAEVTPLALNLFYLITPFAPSAEWDLLLLGTTLQTLYDNAIVHLENSADQVFEELRVILCRLSLEELTRVWEALREPYRLSVCYQVRVMRIDSQRVTQHARVVVQRSDYGDVPVLER